MNHKYINPMTNELVFERKLTGHKCELCKKGKIYRAQFFSKVKSAEWVQLWCNNCDWEVLIKE